MSTVQSESRRMRSLDTWKILIVQLQVRRKCLIFPNKQENHSNEIIKDQKHLWMDPSKKSWAYHQTGCLRNQFSSVLHYCVELEALLVTPTSSSVMNLFQPVPTWPQMCLLCHKFQNCLACRFQCAIWFLPQI